MTPTLLAAVEHYQAFEWGNPHWGWLFFGFALGAIVVLVTHRIRG